MDSTAQKPSLKPVPTNVGEIEFQETGNGTLVTKCVAASPYRYVCRLPEKEAWSAARPYCRLTKLASRTKTQPSSVENNDVYSLVCPWRS